MSNNSTIAFLSSDARKLYRDDILRVTSYPDGFVVKFRYKKSYINNQILSQFENLSSREAIIFFTKGNKLDVPKKDRILKNVPIRKAVIKKVIYQQNTQNYEFYLELREFLHSAENNIEFPDNEFVTYSNQQFHNTSWKTIIDNIKQSFNDSLFYNFKISEGANILAPVFDANENVSYFNFKDENSYFISFSFYDLKNYNASEESSEPQNVFTLKEPFESIVVNIPDELTLDTVIDDRTYNVFTKSLDNKNTNTFLNFVVSQNNKHSEEIIFNDSVRVKINKDTRKVWIFTLHSFLLATSIFLTTICSGAFDLHGSFDYKIGITMFLAVILFGISVFNLFKFFNKK